MSAIFLIALVPAITSGQVGSAEAKRTFQASERKLNAAKSIGGSLVGTGPCEYKSVFLFQKPRSFRDISGEVDIYSNGKVQFNHLVREKEYFSRDVSKARAVVPITALDGFFGASIGETAPYFVKSTDFRMQSVNGRKCAAKALHFESFGRDDRMVFFVDVDTKMPIGWDQVFGGAKMQYRFSDLRLNIKVQPGSFDWKPSPDLKERKTNGLHR